MRNKSLLFTIAFVLLAGLQILVYKAYVEREIAWGFVFRGDTNWYNFYAYRFFEAVLRRDWAELYFYTTTFPWGVVLFLESIGLQLLFGASRFSLGVINLVYFLIAQWATFTVFRRIGGSPWSGVAAVMLLMAMRTPFRGDGPGLNIVDFHFDLVFFYVFLCIIYLVAWSDSFARRWPSILIAAVCALTVATRLVSFFLLIGIFGAFFLYLLLAWWRARPAEKRRAGTRVGNLILAGLAFILFCAPAVWIAADAIYAHYFRFVFEADIRENRGALYKMGASLGEEAYQLIRRMVVFDFGERFAVATGLVTLLALLGWGLRRPVPAASAPPVEGQGGMLDRIWGDRPARNTFIGFLLIAIFVSYFMHLAFPIKSDHLTRMTAAPIVVLIAFLAAVPIGRLFSQAGWRRYSAAGLLAALGLVAVNMQFAFYGAKGRIAAERPDIQKVTEIYADISRIVHSRGLKAVAISIDQISNALKFELDALLGYYTYEYETHANLLKWRPQLGDKIDEKITLPDARRLVDRSDFILLLEGKYPENPYWPFMQSIGTFHGELTQYVQSRFCLLGRYRIGGETNALYTRPFAWHVRASASTQKQFGPEGLLGPGGIIWHAPWSAKTSQQLSFAAPLPVKLGRIKMTAQDLAANRAPRDFMIEALDDDGTVRPVLTVTGASFEGQMTRTFDIPAYEKPARRYRMTITRNNGDPNLLTIQDMQVDLAELACEHGAPVR